MSRHLYIWRLERDGKGAFRANGLIRDIEIIGKHRLQHNCDPRYPPDARREPKFAPLFDCYGNFDESYYFGFATLEQYRKWFNARKIRIDLALCRGTLRKYKVPAEYVVDGDHQIVFKIGKARMVDSRSPDYR